MSVVDFVRGRVVERGADSAVIAVGGIGLRVLVGAATADALPEPGNEAMLYTYLQVREDALILYGFATADERALFNQLLTVNGVGPKVALAALSAAPPDRLRGLIAAGDAASLARIPGIGAKTAQRIVLDLKGKLPAPAAPAAAASAQVGAPGGPFDIAAQALRELGFTPAEVNAALARLPADRDLSEEEAIALALREVGPVR